LALHPCTVVVVVLVAHTLYLLTCNHHRCRCHVIQIINIYKQTWGFSEVLSLQCMHTPWDTNRRLMAAELVEVSWVMANQLAPFCKLFSCNTLDKYIVFTVDL
jgi:hypothetical protein